MTLLTRGMVSLASDSSLAGFNKSVEARTFLLISTAFTSCLQTAEMTICSASWVNIISYPAQLEIGCHRRLWRDFRLHRKFRPATHACSVRLWKTGFLSWNFACFMPIFRGHFLQRDMSEIKKICLSQHFISCSLDWSGVFILLRNLLPTFSNLYRFNEYFLPDSEKHGVSKFLKRVLSWMCII